LMLLLLANVSESRKEPKRVQPGSLHEILHHGDP
jgi:hypothetical protein